MTDDAREKENEHDDATDATDGQPPAEPSPDDVAAIVAAHFPGSVAYDSHGQQVVYVDGGELAAVAEYLRDEQQFSMCMDVTAVDHLLDGVRHCPHGVTPERFEVVANFLSHVRNLRVRVIAQVAEDNPVVPSLTGVFPGTNFAEREVYDLLGIRFEGHPDLVRILMPDDWDGHPLRKDAHPARVPVTFKGDPSPR